MNVLLIGSGGREHALAWKLAQSPRLEQLFAAPGNPGIAEHARIVDLDPADHAGVIGFCTQHRIGLVVVGPEAPLVDGLGDSLRAAGIGVFGPDRIPAQLEGSKGFTKDLCAANDIPTARYRRADNRADAEAALEAFGLPVVIKADGLAAGKGVVIAAIAEEASAALDMMFDGTFGEAGALVVIEEYMTGEEASFFALTDGKTILPFGSAQDHKRVGDGDTGPNTGGMGAYSPTSIVTPEIERQVMDEIIQPTVRALADAGTPYSGVLFAGLMLTEQGPRLIEYNARFGDPECQVLMMRLDQDLLELLIATAEGRLGEIASVKMREASALTIVLAAEGYPAGPRTGGAIALPEQPGEGAKIFQAGTRRVEEGLVASGGRVLNATAIGESLTEARDRAYSAAEEIDFESGFYRRDIGWREIARGR